jgi:hypothetical protein
LPLLIYLLRQPWRPPATADELSQIISPAFAAFTDWWFQIFFHGW